MSTTFQGVYRDGVIIPTGPVPFQDGAVLDLTLSPSAQPDSITPLEPGWLLKVFEPCFVDSPDLPQDLSTQHDHYLYGTPKK